MLRLECPVCGLRDHDELPISKMAALPIKSWPMKIRTIGLMLFTCGKIHAGVILKNGIIPLVAGRSCW